MATPFVSALAGLVATATPGISNTAIVQQMQQTATSSTGAGGWNQDLGYGVINAYNAISGAVRPASVGGVVGQVIDTFTPQTSTPINGAQITINGQTVITDSTGSGLFRFPNLAPGTYSVSAAASGYAAQSLTVTVAAGADTPMIVAMASSYGRFSGTVTDAGTAVPGAVVQALSAGLIAGVTVADQNGAYILWVPGGFTAYILQASAAGRTSVASAGMSVAVGGNTVANLTLPRMGTISGSVLDASSHLISGAQVMVSGIGFSASATTTAGGTYTLIGLPNSTYSVTASVSGLTPVTQTGVVVSTDIANIVNLQFSGGLPVVASPVISPAGGTFTTAQAVTVTTATIGASIRYTTDGSAPTETNGTLYNGAIPISGATTLKAIAFEAGMIDSSVTSAGFTINVEAPGWYNSAWSSRKPVTIPSTAGSASLANFPLLISLPSDANLAASAQSSGNDILFTAADGVTKLNHQIELYSGANGRLIAWVQVPVLAPGTAIYLYYGNPGAASQQNPTGVWDSNYKAVWHMEDHAANTIVAESTSNGYTGIDQANTSGKTVTGEIGSGLTYNGSTDYTTANAAALGNTAVTISAWVQDISNTDATFAYANGAAIFSTRDAGPDFSPALVITPSAGGAGSNLGVAFVAESNNMAVGAKGATTISTGTGTWYYVVGTFNNDGTATFGGQWNVYVNGAQDNAAANNFNLAGSFSGGFTGATWNLARDPQWGGVSNINLNELRVSSTVRSSGWIATEYSNQSSPSTFISVGGQQSNGGAVSIAVTSVPAGLTVTVDGAVCTTPCAAAQWTPGTVHTIAAANQSGAAGTQYLFSSWSDNGAASHSVTAPASATTYTASFTTQYFLTTAASPSSEGSISPVSGWVNAGTVVSIGATPASGDQFTGFTGALSGATTPQNLTMNAPASVTANFTVANGGTSWYNSAWSSRKPLTIPSTSGSASLANFPLLISLPSDANLAASAQSSGNDILFTAADGVTKLNHQIELYSGANGRLIAWVQVPVLAPGTAIYLYYGNPGAASQQNPTGVWDSNYKAVWHMEDHAANTIVAESTSNGYTGIDQANTSGKTVTGEIGSGLTYNGSTDYTTANAAALGNTAVTISAWVQDISNTDATFAYANGAAIFSTRDAGPDFSPALVITPSAGGAGSNLGVAFVAESNNMAVGAKGATTISTGTGTWYYVVGTFNNDGTATFGGQWNVYVNGAQDNAAANNFNLAGSFSGGFTGATWNLARDPQWGGVSNINLNELRVSSTVRSSGWIATEYSNQSSPSTFISVGGQQSNGGASSAHTSLP